MQPIGNEKRKSGGKMAKKRYKVKRHGDGSFSVWELKDYGQGWAWIDTGRRYPTEEKAFEAAKRECESDENDRWF